QPLCPLLIAINIYYATPTMSSLFSFFFFNDTATTEIYTLSLHDALPILRKVTFGGAPSLDGYFARKDDAVDWLMWSNEATIETRSEEHTSELQSLAYLVCRLLLEKKKKSHVQSAAVAAEPYISPSSIVCC